jgi:septal ring factor EnvC (AmiA/AmiB activator)
MAKASPFEPLSRRLSVYGYLAPLVDGARVLEIGTGEGGGAAHLLRLGASAVVGADGDPQLLARARASHREPGLSFQPLERRALEAGGGFDLIVVPDAGSLLRATGGLTITAARALLSGPQGRLVLLVPSADRPGSGHDGGSGNRTSAGFYEVTEALERLFPRVRMFGVTPFAAYGVAEFSEATSGLRIDGGLVEEAAEQPTHYLAVAGPDDGVELGYALVQIPVEVPGHASEGRDVRPAAGGVPAAVDGSDVADLRRRLAESEGKAEGVLRVSRAQTEEIEELRARLRRAAESRAELDQEVDRLRKALAEADESVLDLTRRTREEMAALASRITAGLRPGDGAGGDDGPTARLREEIRRREEELAARESALSERDERIAGLEGDRQDLQWQVDAGGEPVAAVRAPEAEPARAPASMPLAPYRLAAAAHLQEVNHLREALAEQATLVAELEDSLSARDAKLVALEAELRSLRKHAAEIEQADRSRRSRLAEVEGTLLRLQRQAALAASQPAEPGSGNGAAVTPDFDRTNQALAGQVAGLENRLREADQTRSQLEHRYGDAVERLAAMERALAEQTDRVTASSAAEAADAPRLEVALREVSRLREALERSEEQLWETKGQLLLDRERMAVMEHELGNAAAASAPAPNEPTITEAAHQSIMKSVLTELVELETSIRQELERLDSVERMIDGWRADLAVDADAPFTGPNQ